MRRFFIYLLCYPFITSPMVLVASSTVTIVDLRVQALYRAAKISWKVKGDFKNPISLLIMRADTFKEGPYKEVEIITLTPGKNSYEYIDKSMGTEVNYYYKLVLEETGESFGPLPVRPYFSPPAT